MWDARKHSLSVPPGLVSRSKKLKYVSGRLTGWPVVVSRNSNLRTAWVIAARQKRGCVWWRGPSKFIEPKAPPLRLLMPLRFGFHARYSVVLVTRRSMPSLLALPVSLSYEIAMSRK